MTATNSPYGFRAVKLHGTDPQQNVYAPIGYNILSTYNTSIFAGDPVKLSGTADTKGRPGIQLATLSDNPNNVVGTFAGVQYYDPTIQKTMFIQKWTAGQTYTGDCIAFVYDHEDTIFSVQGNATIAATDVGNDADWATGTGGSTTLQSGYTLDASSIGTGTGLQILGLDPAGSGSFDAFPNILVLFREHQKRGNAAGGWPVAV